MRKQIMLILFCMSSYALVAQGFITTWKTDASSSSNTTIIIPTTGTGYNYSIDWGDGSAVETGITGDISHTYSTVGSYSVEINGDFPRIYFNYGNQRNLISKVTQWGNIQWNSMASAFRGCTNIEILAADTPDLSNVTDMSNMFESTDEFNQDISNWDVSNVTNMQSMFRDNVSSGVFNQNLNAWNVSNVTDMSYMFFGARSYNQDMSSWNVSNVTNMSNMFIGAWNFNQDIGNWNVSNVEDMSGMFASAFTFNQGIDSWDVSSVANMKGMFSGTNSFNQDIGNWNVSNVTDMSQMFQSNNGFNQDISAWNTSSVIHMYQMFQDSNVSNPNIGSWDVSNVTRMESMFKNNSVFNQDISAWKTSKVERMREMFKEASNFNQNIGAWDTSGVFSMDEMFYNATSFNQDIGSWDLSSASNIDFMFWGATSFNQDLSNWDVSNLFKLRGVFGSATSFDQSLGAWDISNVGSMSSLFENITLSTANYDATLIGWANIDTVNGETQIRDGVYFDGGNSKYCNSDAERTQLIDTYGWNITDGGLDATCGTSTWYQDSDNDTFGNLNVSTVAVSQPAGYVLDNTDCDDTNAAINPNATEICDGIDNNCNGSIDEGLLNTYYADTDGDTFGDASNSVQDCGTAPTGYVSDNTDCDDTNIGINPSATDLANNGIDENCDGFDLVTWYQDSDSDNYGNPSATLDANTQPTGYVSDNTDCDDTNAGINPGATEISGNGIDEDCDGSDALTWYEDSDGDSFGNPNISQEASTQPTGYVADNTDCDDTEANAYPGNTEVCDGIDNNCDGNIDEVVTITFYADADGDGFGDASDTIQACSAPAGYVADDTDCDDTEANNYPGNIEVCDGIDNDCDGLIDDNDDSLANATTWYADSDGDGYGDASNTVTMCSVPTGYVSDNTDCDDTEASAHPNGTEIPNDGIDQDCNGSDLILGDADSDGVFDNIDNCINTPNPNQTDSDNDGIGDECDVMGIIVPKGFSPNSDGKNDTWVIENIMSFSRNNIKVFNRWGNKVFESNNYQNNWDGKSTESDSSEQLPVGAYLYIIELNEPGFTPVQGWIYINY